MAPDLSFHSKKHQERRQKTISRKVQKVHVIVNPAAGSGQPDLQTIDEAFNSAGVDWRLCITRQAGDAARYAHEALNAGTDVVAAYGGDGTVSEVAAALAGSAVPLAILPGGTGNSVATELSIPLDLAQAADLVAGNSPRIQTLDLGQAGEQIFVSTILMGFLAEIALTIDESVKGSRRYPTLLWTTACWM